jgi:hypothetical protein
MSERYSRQVRLVEIGLEGQRRIASSAHVVRGNELAARVEARYLVGAGVGAIAVENEPVAAAAREVDASAQVRVRDPDREPDLDADRDPLWACDLALPARSVALGAYRALRALRAVALSTREPSP